MTTTIQSTDLIGTGTQVNLTVAQSGYFLLEGVTLASTNSSAIVASGLDTAITIAGTVFGDSRALTLNGDDSLITITSTGSVSSNLQAYSNASVYLAGGNSTLRNDGTISDLTAIAVLSSEAVGGDSIVNTGTIHGSSGVFIGLAGKSGDSLVNSGTITAGDFEDDNSGGRYHHAVFSEGPDTVITNLAGGVLIGTAIEGAGVTIGSASGTGSGSVFNWGEITSAQWWGVDFGTSQSTVASTFDNDGVVSGGTGSFRGNDLSDIVTNTGTMLGDVDLQGGDDILTNSGLIIGDIAFGDGDDTYEGEGGVVSNGSAIRMGSGNDTFNGGDKRDRVFDDGGDDDVEGNGGNDSFRAGSGANFYDGGDGYDYLSYYSFSTRVRIDLKTESVAGGGGGNAASNDRFINIEAIGGTNGGGDTLLGSDERNSLFGWGGNDKLYGRGGNDKLDGGSGNDFFDGGGGTDQLIGGSGADAFHFDRGEGDDVIVDFENNVDVLQFDNFGYLSTAASALTYADQSGDDVYFDFGSDGSVLVLGVTTGQLANDIDIV